MSSPRHILLQLPQLPADPASGAARSMLGTVEILAADKEHWQVYSLGTTASEKQGGVNMPAFFQQLGIVPEEKYFSGQRLWRYKYRAIEHTVLDVGNVQPHEWEARLGGVYNTLYERILRQAHINMVVTYGGNPEAFARRRIAKEKGCAVVFGLRNLGYLFSDAFRDVDAIFTPSEFLSRRYRRTLAVESTPLPMPMEIDDIVAPQHERIFVTAINPSVDKGLFFLTRLVEELGVHRPDIPILVIESRGNAGQLIATGRAAGFDLTRHESIMMSQGVAKPRDIYAVTRVLLVPSVWEEPSGRVGAEALLNGIPALVSDRGGLPENVGDGGIVLPLPAAITPTSRVVATAEEVGQWRRWIERLADDEKEYANWSERALKAGEKYHPAPVAAAIGKFFSAIASGKCQAL